MLLCLRPFYCVHMALLKNQMLPKKVAGNDSRGNLSCRLKSLKRLILRENRFRRLPRLLARLPGLEYLELSFNNELQVHAIPHLPTAQTHSARPAP